MSQDFDQGTGRAQEPDDDDEAEDERRWRELTMRIAIQPFGAALIWDMYPEPFGWFEDILDANPELTAAVRAIPRHPVEWANEFFSTMLAEGVVSACVRCSEEKDPRVYDGALCVQEALARAGLAGRPVAGSWDIYYALRETFKFGRGQAVPREIDAISVLFSSGQDWDLRNYAATPLNGPFHLPHGEETSLPRIPPGTLVPPEVQGDDKKTMRYFLKILNATWPPWGPNSFDPDASDLEDP